MTATLTALTALTGCTGAAPPIEAAPQATAPVCRAATSRLPERLLGKSRTPINVDGAASWGEPAVILRCGVPVVTATSAPCQSVNGADWVFDQSVDPVVFTTFGRSPGLEVRVPKTYGLDQATTALEELGAVVNALPRTGKSCS